MHILKVNIKEGSSDRSFCNVTKRSCTKNWSSRTILNNVCAMPLDYEYHYNRLSSSINPTRQDTRSKENNLVRIDLKLSLARSSYFYQAPQVWSSLPLQIRMLKTIESFKTHCSEWIKSNVLEKI